MPTNGENRDQALRRRAVEYHERYRGKIEVCSRVPLAAPDELSLAYSPGVAEPCREIHRNRERVYDVTIKGNFVAVVSDGSAVLGLGNIGPEAAMPVMEGKALLFKAFADVDAVPLCLDASDPEKLIATVMAVAPSFGGINLEDIAAPACFEIEARLKQALDIPVFHDDQHGTAVVVGAALLNAAKLAGKELADLKVVFSGAGASGLATATLLNDLGVKQMIVCDSRGAIYRGRPEGMNPYKERIAAVTNPDRVQGSLGDVIAGADVFIGLSQPGILTQDMVRSMAADPIIMAMANPDPEIYPDEALAAGAKVVCTGRSDFPNQINNVLAFPGVFRGALDVRATGITEGMKKAAARAIAGLIEPDELRPEYIIPSAWDERVVPTVAAAVAEAATAEGVARLPRSPQEVYDDVKRRVQANFEKMKRIAARDGGEATA